MKALIIGATGATGTTLTEQLLNHANFSHITVFVRKPLALMHPKLTVEVIDFDKPDTWADKVRGDVLFSCLGTTLKQAGSKANQYKIDYTYQYNFAKIAKQNGINHYVLVSSGMANANSKAYYTRLKGELDNAVMALNFNRLTILRPPLLKRPNSDRLGEVWADKILTMLGAFGVLSSQKPMPTDDLAHAMIQAVLQPATGILEKSQIWALIKS